HIRIIFHLSHALVQAFDNLTLPQVSSPYYTPHSTFSDEMYPHIVPPPTYNLLDPASPFSSSPTIRIVYCSETTSRLEMLASRSAAFVCLTLVSLVAAKCKKLHAPPQPGFWDKAVFFMDNKPRYNLYLYKGDDCTGEALKHKRKDATGDCINLPEGWNNKVRSMEGGLSDVIQMTMYKDADCKKEYGMRVGPFFISDMEKGKTCTVATDTRLSLKQWTKDMRNMSSYRMEWRQTDFDDQRDPILNEITYCIDRLATFPAPT
ncbi:hypothetical protein BJ138DRAFT_1158425, partial [Hygrophoropsis aurantiaca]